MTPARSELLRAIGAVAADPSDARTASRALGLPGPDNAEHTEVFVLNCPPYAAVYLGQEGSLGGDAADRVAGFWRAIGTGPPAEPDHLTALLGLYASLGDAERDARSASVAEALGRARHALFWEHMWPWLPGYLEAVSGLRTPVLTGWAALATRVLAAERAAHPGGWLPLALRSAPGPLTLRSAPDPPAARDLASDVTRALTTPVRAGLILTRRRLAAGAEAAGAGCRIGERRFTVRAMLDQAPAETLHWLESEAAAWSSRHAAAGPSDIVQQWWARRARHTARVLHDAAVQTSFVTAG